MKKVALNVVQKTLNTKPTNIRAILNIMLNIKNHVTGFYTNNVQITEYVSDAASENLIRVQRCVKFAVRKAESKNATNTYGKFLIVVLMALAIAVGNRLMTKDTNYVASVLSRTEKTAKTLTGVNTTGEILTD